MKDADLHAAGDLVATTLAGGSVIYLLREGSQRPQRETAWEGGLLPDPQGKNAGESTVFYAGGMIARWLIYKFVGLPLLAVWAAITAGPIFLICDGQTVASGDPDPTCIEPGNPQNLCDPLVYHSHMHNLWFAAIWIPICLYFGFKFFRGLFFAIEGRPSKHRRPTPAEAIRVQSRPTDWVTASVAVPVVAPEPPPYLDLP